LYSFDEFSIYVSMLISSKSIFSATHNLKILLLPSVCNYWLKSDVSYSQCVYVPSFLFPAISKGVTYCSFPWAFSFVMQHVHHTKKKMKTAYARSLTQPRLRDWLIGRVTTNRIYGKPRYIIITFDTRIKCPVGAAEHQNLNSICIRKVIQCRLLNFKRLDCYCAFAVNSWHVISTVRCHVTFRSLTNTSCICLINGEIASLIRVDVQLRCPVSARFYPNFSRHLQCTTWQNSV
jgi:hypothetical protein